MYCMQLRMRHGFFFEHMFVICSAALLNQSFVVRYDTTKYLSEINKSHPQIRAALLHSSKAEIIVAAATIRINTVDPCY